LKLRYVLTLFTAALAVYGAGLFQAPSGSDQLLHYSSVAHTANPLRYFAADVVTVLLGVMLRITPQKDHRLPMLLALVALISPYSVSAANWTPDRPTLLVAIFLLLAVRHLFLDGARPRLAIAAAFAVLALLSKESGVIVPAIVCGYGVAQRRPRFAIAGAVLIGAYLALRVALFGGNAIAYGESGSLFGVWWYEDSSQFTGINYVVMLADNAIKHIVAIALPVFGEEGDWLTGRALLVQAPLWGLTAALIALASARLSRPQVIALSVIAVNALIHAAVFRYRMLYVSQLALMAFLAASTALTSPARRRWAIAIATGLLLFSVFRVEQAVFSNLREAGEILASPQFGDVGDDHAIAVDPDIVKAIKRVYLR
jgi:hypothetical protein